MSEKKKDKILNAEREMIRNLRKRIYGNSNAGPDYSQSESNNICIFCGAESDLHSYKNSYICGDCVSDINE